MSQNFKDPLDPREKLPYLFNWGAWLLNEDETIVAGSQAITISPVENPVRLIAFDIALIDVIVPGDPKTCPPTEDVTVVDGGVQVSFRIEDANKGDADYATQSGKVYDISCQITTPSGKEPFETVGLRVRLG